MPTPNRRHVHVSPETLDKIRALPQINVRLVGALGFLAGVDIFPEDKDPRHGSHLLRGTADGKTRVFIE